MYSGVISVFSERIRNGLPITIYGDGRQTRDFVSVADVVQANLLAMGVQKSEVKGQKSDQPNPCHLPPATCHLPPVTRHLPPATFSVFNVATGKQTSLLDLVAALGKLCGATSEVKFSPSRPGDIQHSLADISKVRKLLVYEPRISLRDGLNAILFQE
jgi:UDP-glucose 4-epimerase